MGKKPKFHVVVIIGSSRPDCYSGKAAQVVADYLRDRSVSVDLIDPKLIAVPYIGAPFAAETVQNLQQRVAQADGVIFCTPEYNGSFSSALMAIIEHLGYPAAYSHKPVTMLGVAAGTIGAIKALEHLRSVCGHSGAIVLPGSISVAHVYDVFDDSGQIVDEQAKQLIESVPQGLLHFLHSSWHSI